MLSLPRIVTLLLPLVGTHGGKFGLCTDCSASAAGAAVPNSFEDFPRVISEVYNKLLATNVIHPAPEPSVPFVPANFGTAVKVTESVHSPGAHV